MKNPPLDSNHSNFRTDFTYKRKKNVDKIGVSYILSFKNSYKSPGVERRVGLLSSPSEIAIPTVFSQGRPQREVSHWPTMVTGMKNLGH